jgi:hypothetical protein
MHLRRNGNATGSCKVRDFADRVAGEIQEGDFTWCGPFDPSADHLSRAACSLAPDRKGFRPLYRNRFYSVPTR